MLALPALEGLDPDAVEDVPSLGGSAWWWTFVLVSAQCAALSVRGARPTLSASVVAAAVPAAALAGVDAGIGLLSLPLVVAVYTIGVRRTLADAGWLLTSVVVLVCVGHVVVGLQGGGPVGAAVFGGLLQGCILVGAPLAVAAVVTTRRESRVAREERVQALERERDALVEAAVARERAAMARELHDIAAHHLTGIAVMSAAVAIQIDTAPAEAKVAVAEMRRQSTAVLRDLRSLVGLLREHDATVSLEGARTETLGGIAGLVGDVGAAGQDVELTVLEPVDGRPSGAGIGPLAQLGAYRMVQEALANAGRHAPGARCGVEVDDRDPAALVVTVRNTAARRDPDPGGRGGLGLVGMRERAELTGSLLDAGPLDDGGWMVRLVTPRADMGEDQQ
ncbi:sensor histidine kinase [Nocardioides sambongensis]|uniref:sensor histidine kinase n=1 Tax=Nocardioides sambongensis TaxID=2589074 RepID=UPI0015E82F97|nr:sensor histidine kinase [Nocardioides sambongensis]